ncbi:hypothetical protein N8T08_006168 [Aspergillus melleus]|uniref:Uncharacterized protein n=1 Tax=Aspergillus melleus TaxID=138277 RepID=A0ACC3B0W1_9EURO|nr:hypothetical protein N8T08_006168 [Aspergillus melleus]
MVVLDIDLDYGNGPSTQLLKVLKVRKASSLESKGFWDPRKKQEPSLPSYLASALDDFTLAFSPRADSALVRSRVNTILFSVVAAIKRKHVMSSAGLANSLRASKDWESLEKDSGRWPKFNKVDCLRLSVGQQVTMPDLSLTPNRYLRSSADEIVWYGDVENLDAILVVHETTSPFTDENILLPPAMLMLHYNRRRAGKRSKLYGIVTNSYQWCFVKMEHGGQYFQTLLDWRHRSEKDTIIDHLRYIIDQALGLLRGSPINILPPQGNISSSTECVVWNDLNESNKVDKSDDEMGSGGDSNFF